MTTEMKTQRVLPADVYDALELSALIFGGVGGNNMFAKDGCPLCIHGHAAFLWNGDVGDALYATGITTFENDGAVQNVNRSEGRPPYDRISFEEWCAALNVIRGDN